jgi:hypothetical protein
MKVCTYLYAQSLAPLRISESQLPHLSSTLSEDYNLCQSVSLSPRAIIPSRILC